MKFKKNQLQILRNSQRKKSKIRINPLFPGLQAMTLWIAKVCEWAVPRKTQTSQQRTSLSKPLSPAERSPFLHSAKSHGESGGDNAPGLPWCLLSTEHWSIGNDTRNQKMWGADFKIMRKNNFQFRSLYMGKLPVKCQARISPFSGSRIFSS